MHIVQNAIARKRNPEKGSSPAQAKHGRSEEDEDAEVADDILGEIDN